MAHSPPQQIIRHYQISTRLWQSASHGSCARMTRTDREVFLFACSAAPSRIVDRNVDRIARNVRIVRLLLSFHFNNLSSVDHESSKPLMPVIVRSESNMHCCTAASIRFAWPLRKDDTHTSRRVTNCIIFTCMQANSMQTCNTLHRSGPIAQLRCCCNPHVL